MIVFTDPRTTAGIVIEWYGGRAPNDPRLGTPIPPYTMTPVLDVERMAFAGAVVDDVGVAADRLAEVLGTTVTFRDGDRAGVSLGDMTLALWPVPDPSSSERLWGHVYRRAQTSSLGVQVPDLADAVEALRGAGVKLVRRRCGRGGRPSRRDGRDRAGGRRPPPPRRPPWGVRGRSARVHRSGGLLALVNPHICARSSTDRASDYGSEGWGFESLRAR